MAEKVEDLDAHRKRLRGLERAIERAANHEDVDLDPGIGYEIRYLRRLIAHHEMVARIQQRGSNEAASAHRFP